MRNAEYTVKEMKDFIDMMSGMYDLARVVDPVECRVLELKDDGQVGMCGSCYDVWQADQRCMNCSSFAACRTGVHTEKSEHFKDNLYRIHSNPVKIKLPDGGMFDAVVELVSVFGENDGKANDRESENIDNKAAVYQAHHDALTRVLNAEAFFELSRNRIINTPNTSWVMITGNVMEFRMINTLFGEAKGNEILMKIAELLQTIARDAGGLCGRLAGDEFAMMIPGLMYKEEALYDVAQKLAGLITNGTFTICMHFGVYDIQDPDLPISVMCDRANMALQTIRDDIRGTVAYFHSGMMKKRIYEQEIISHFEEDLRLGKFIIHLQPITSKDGRPFAAEALVRWIRPDGECGKPVEFIGVLESAGLIPELDTYVWELAVKQLKEWEDTPMRDIAISVNMSARDLYYIDIFETLTGLVKKYGVNSRRLRLEITESTLIEDPEKTITILKKLHDAGFYIEIDDFGKGYSSLSLLRDIHADMLKIDMGFLQATENADRSMIIVGAIIDMANLLGMDVVTEGVETEEQLDELVRLGCRGFQGYYFSRPVPVEEFVEKYFA